jgi:SAM-dependent methyltransferase
MSVPAAAQEAIWHDVECGAYSADLPVWLELAGQSGGPVLELGAGTGRVSLRLAAEGLEVVALDSSALLLEEVRRRADAAGLELETVCADARRLAIDRTFAAIVAPMQLVHLLGGSEQRETLLKAARSHLRPNGVLAAALLVDDAGTVAVGPSLPPLPDVRELDGWIYSSLPIEVAAVPGGLEIRRLRQIVSPDGELSEAREAIRLDHLGADEFEAEATRAGLVPRERIEIAATDEHVGSMICVLEVG